MPFIVEQSATRSADMVGKPVAMSARNKTILCAMPDDDGTCVSHGESPIASLCNLVVATSCYSVRQPNSECLCKPFGEFARYLSLVNLGKEAAECFGKIGGPHGGDGVG